MLPASPVSRGGFSSPVPWSSNWILPPSPENTDFWAQPRVSDSVGLAGAQDCECHQDLDAAGAGATLRTAAPQVRLICLRFLPLVQALGRYSF